MLILEEITLENFKSYREPVIVKLRQFSSIFGRNGAGKSSLVDAVKFALCFPPYHKVSFQHLEREICNNVGADILSSWVKLKFNKNGEITNVQRTIQYDDPQIKYLINDVEVNRKEYKECLLEFNIHPKANNLLIEQNMIETLVLMDPKERAAYFERLCGSIDHKSEYLNILKELKEVDTQKKNWLKEKNYFTKTKKIVKNLEKETERHNQLTAELMEVEYDYYYAHLYQTDNNIDKLFTEQDVNKKKIRVTEKLIKSTENGINKLKKDIEDNIKNLNISEEKIQSKNNKIEEHLTEMLQLNQKLIVSKDKLAKLEMSLQTAMKVDEAHENIIKDLENQLHKVEGDKNTFSSSQALTSSIELEDEMYTEYLKLKSEAQLKSAKEISLIDSIERERETIKDKFEDFERQKKSLEKRIKTLQLESENLEEKIFRIEGNIQDAELAEKDVQEKYQNLNEKSNELQNNLDTLGDEINLMNQQLIESKESTYENMKSKRRREVLDVFKRVFTGVEGRLLDLCDVNDESYKIAITKLMGNRMNAIVVDTEKTAQKCMELAKKKFAGEKYSVVETFLPINYVKTKSLDKAVESVRHTPNAKIALFAMRSRSAGVQKVLHHVLGDAIIFQTDEEALEISKKYRIDCVTLNGTLFKKNGIISGGLQSLLSKSREWTDKERDNLKNEKEIKINLFHKKIAELREIKEKLSEVISELSKFNNKLEKYLVPLYKENRKDLEKKNEELSVLRNNFAVFDDEYKLDKLQKDFEAKCEKCKQIEYEKNLIEDDVFEDFCASLQIPNIRVYEQGGLIKSQNRIDRVKEYDNLIDNIKNQITFEKERDTKTTIKNLQSRIAKENENFNRFNEEKNKLNALIIERKSSISDDQPKLLRKTIDELEKKLKKEKNSLKLQETDLKKYKTDLMVHTSQILDLRAEKHKLLMECKLKNIKIPLRDGTINKVLLKCGIDTTIKESTDGSNTDTTMDESQLKEKDVEINYERLMEPVKNNVDIIVNDLKERTLDIRKELNKLFEHINAKEDLEQVNVHLQKVNHELDEKSKKVNALKKRFEKVKAVRSALLKDFIDSLQNEVNTVFQAIYNSESAQTYILMRNQDEPYLQGIEFQCGPPQKPLISMENISGAEKAIGALSLLIGINRLRPGPCLIFDEVDAAMDRKNQASLYSYLEKVKSSTEIIIISHQKSINLYTDAAIGVRFNDMSTSLALHIGIDEFRKHRLSAELSDFTIDERVSRFSNRIPKLLSSTRQISLPSMSDSCSLLKRKTNNVNEEEENQY